MTTSGRFTGALGLREEPLTQEAEVKEAQPRPRSRRTRQVVDVRVEPKSLIQARVTRTQKHQFWKTIVDLQQFFEQEVTQEEGIGALLVLASEDAEVREKWMDVIERLRG